jgi:hypothetical protein
LTTTPKAPTRTKQDLAALARQHRAAVAERARLVAAVRKMPAGRKREAAERDTVLPDRLPLVLAASKIKARDAGELALKAGMASPNCYCVADIHLVASILDDAKRLGRKSADN